MLYVFSQARNFAQLLTLQVHERPHHTALRVASTDFQISYLELYRQVIALAGELTERGIFPYDRVALLLPNRVEFILSLLALSHIGAVPMLLDTSYHPQEVEEILLDGYAKGIITFEKQSSNLPSVSFSPLSMPQLSFGRHPLPADMPPMPSDVTLFKYTSGSTGVPRAVMLSAENMLSEGRNIVETLDIDSQDVILAATPLFHSYGFDFCFMPMLIAGATLVLMERFLPRPALRVLQEQRVTIFPAVPFMFDLMTRVALDPKEVDLSHVRYCISAAAPLSARTVRRFYEQFHLVICQNYGSSEAGAITLEVRKKPDVPSTCLGKPLKHVILQIVDEDDRVLPANQVGEVMVGGTQVSTHGYYRESALTEATFYNDFCYTGDLGWLDEQGNLFLSGRKKNLINVGGKKISPTEVEEVLRQHPDILDVAVVGVPDEVLGEVIKACLVTERELDREELISLCQQHLAPFKIPHRWTFWPELPRNAVGKIDTTRLKG